MSNSTTPDAATAALGTAVYLITAAPQCIFPDAHLGPQTEGLVLTNSAMQIDYVWPQFYNNPSCQFNSSDEGAGFQQSFQTWSSWAASAAPSLEVLVGLPASPSAAGTGYMAVDDEEEQIKLIRAGNATNFDGIMLWSAAWESANAQMNQSYLPTVLASLTGKAFTSSSFPSVPAYPLAYTLLNLTTWTAVSLASTYSSKRLLQQGVSNRNCACKKCYSMLNNLLFFCCRSCSQRRRGTAGPEECWLCHDGRSFSGLFTIVNVHTYMRLTVAPSSFEPDHLLKLTRQVLSSIYLFYF